MPDAMSTRKVPGNAALPKHSLQFILMSSEYDTNTDIASTQPPSIAKTPTSTYLARSTIQRPAKSDKEKRHARQCTIDGCANYIINNGRCFRHGGGKKCTVDGCDASAKVAGRCWKHGGSVQCSVPECERRGKSRGLCWAHGGGTLCEAHGCSKVAVSNGFCWAHGGGKRCLFDGCQRPAYERTLNYCPRHFKLFEQGHEVLEI